MNSALALAAIAGGITKGVDYLRHTFDKEDRAPKEVWVGIALVGGVLFALWAKANLLIGVAWAKDVGVMSGRLMTGFAIGAAASGWHELLDALSGVAKLTHARAKALLASIRQPGPPTA